MVLWGIFVMALIFCPDGGTKHDIGDELVLYLLIRRGSNLVSICMANLNIGKLVTSMEGFTGINKGCHLP